MDDAGAVDDGVVADVPASADNCAVSDAICACSCAIVSAVVSASAANGITTAAPVMVRVMATAATFALIPYPPPFNFLVIICMILIITLRKPFSAVP